MAEHIGAWIAHRLLGGPWGESLSYNLARIGLHGLGIAPPFDFERSGEQRVYNALLRKLPNARCLDVGASDGEFTTMLVDFGAAHVVAAEPIPSTFERLAHNTSIFGNVKLVCCAVGERDGQISIDVPEGNEYSNLSSRDIRVTDVADRRHRTEIVQLRSIDSLVEENMWRFDIVKIDVEGFELEVLQGAAGLLADDPPSILQFEFNSHHGRRGQHLKTLTDQLPGYAFYRIAPRSLRPIDPGHYLSCIYTYQNILAVRQDRTDLIATH